MPELRIPIRMVFPLFGLAVALQTVAQKMQNLGHFGMADRMLAPGQGIGDGALLWQVQRRGDSGSPRVCSSIIASILSTNCVGLGNRLAPGARTADTTGPCHTGFDFSDSLGIALRDKPPARLTRLTPPRPRALASLAAVRRRVRSSKCGQMARNFALSSGRVLTPEQHNADRYPCLSNLLISLFIYEPQASKSMVWAMSWEKLRFSIWSLIRPNGNPTATPSSRRHAASRTE